MFIYTSVSRVLIIMMGMVCLLAFTDPVEAQNFDVPDRPANIQGGIGILGGFPVGEFGDNVTDPGGGLSGHIGYRIPESPVIIGLDIAYIIYGRERRTERFSLTIPDVTVDVVTDNNIFMGDFFIRLQPREGIVRPYADGLIGLHYLFTETSIQDIPSIFEDDIASSTNFDDIAFAYGGGGGIMIRVYDGSERRKQESGAIKSVSIDLRMRYLAGSRASYLRKGDVTRQSGQVTLNITNSRTNIVTAFLGAALEF